MGVSPLPLPPPSFQSRLMCQRTSVFGIGHIAGRWVDVVVVLLDIGVGVGVPAADASIQEEEKN